MTKKYIAKAFLAKDGKGIKPESEIELTPEQATRLGDKVVLVEGQDEVEVTLDSYSVAELKGIAEDKGLEDYSKLNKGNLIELIEGKEQEQE